MWQEYATKYSAVFFSLMQFSSLSTAASMCLLKAFCQSIFCVLFWLRVFLCRIFFFFFCFMFLCVPVCVHFNEWNKLQMVNIEWQKYLSRTVHKFYSKAFVSFARIRHVFFRVLFFFRQVDTNAQTIQTERENEWRKKMK